MVRYLALPLLVTVDLMILSVEAEPAVEEEDAFAAGVAGWVAEVLVRDQVPHGYLVQVALPAIRSVALHFEQGFQ
jgi:hypothetical protein